MDFSEVRHIGQGRGGICKVCGKEGHRINIMDHIETHHIAGISLYCNLCGKTFMSRMSIRMHVLKKRKIWCQFSGQGVSWGYTLIRQNVTQHFFRQNVTQHSLRQNFTQHFFRTSRGLRGHKTAYSSIWQKFNVSFLPCWILLQENLKLSTLKDFILWLLEMFYASPGSN